MDRRPIFSTLATALLPLLVLCACQRDMGTLTLQEAREHLNTPTTLSRGVDYLGSDEEFHYFEHRQEIARDVRFRIRCTDGIYLPHETMPYRSWCPERRDAYSTIAGLHLTIHPDFSCEVEGRTYPGPAAVPAEFWPRVGTVHFLDKRHNKVRQMEQQLAPYLKNTPDVHFTYPISGLSPHEWQPTNNAEGHELNRSGSGSISGTAMEALMQKKN